MVRECNKYNLLDPECNIKDFNAHTAPRPEVVSTTVQD